MDIVSVYLGAATALLAVGSYVGWRLLREYKRRNDLLDELRQASSKR